MKRKVLSLILATLMVLAFTGCGSTTDSAEGTPTPEVETTPTPEPTPTDIPFDLDAYKTLVNACRADINSAHIFVGNVGNYENNYWKTLGRMSDTMVDSAFEWLAKNSDESRETVDAAYENIRQQYKAIILTEIEGKEAEEIDSAFRNMYDAYSSMYSLVILPSGSRSSFAANLVDYMNIILDCDEDLALFLDE